MPTRARRTLEDFHSDTRANKKSEETPKETSAKRKRKLSKHTMVKRQSKKDVGITFVCKCGWATTASTERKAREQFSAHRKEQAAATD